MAGPDISVAHGAPATVPVGTKVDLHVRVRDMGGRPLGGARVDLGFPHGDARTDASGAAVFKGITASGTVTITATYWPKLGRPKVTPETTTTTVSPTTAFDPSPLMSPGTATPEVHVIVRMAVRRPLLHLFPWQNRAIRDRIFIDGKTVEPFLSQHAADRPEFNRELRLRDFVREFDPQYAAVTEAQAKVKKAIDAIAAEEKEAKADEARLAKDRKAVADHPMPDPSTSAAPTRAAKSAADKLKRDEDAAKKNAEELAKARQRLVDAEAALESTRASRGGSTHRSLLTYIVDDVFKREPIDDWIKFGVVHFSGLRYRPSPGCCEPAEDIVLRIRKKELRENEHPSSSALGDAAFVESQQRLAREYLAYLAHPDHAAVLADVAHGYAAAFKAYTGVPLSPKKMPKGKGPESLLGILTDLARRPDGWLPTPPPPDKPKAKPALPMSLYELRAAALATTEVWWRQSIGSAAPSIPDLSEIHGELTDRWFNDQMPKPVWERIVASTQLIHDFFDPAWDVTPKYWNQKPAAPVPDEWEGVFRDADEGWEAWFETYKKSLNPSVTANVCNDVASLLAHARGVGGTGGESIMSMMRKVYGAGQAAAAERAKATPPTPAPTTADDAFVGVFRPRSFAEVRSGDLIFFAKWVKLSDSKVWSHPVVPAHVNGLAANPTPDWEVRPALAKELGDLYPGFAEALARGVDEYPWLSDLGAKVRAKGDVVYGFAKIPKPPPAPKKLKPGETPKPPPEPTDAELVPRVVKAYSTDDPDAPGFAVLVYFHIATVVRPKPKEHKLVMLETNAPTGIRVRSREDLIDPGTWFGRLPAGTPMKQLEYYLDRSRLIDRDRLDE